MMPWKLLTDFSSYIFGWLVGYSGLLGPIAGVMIADYFLVRRARLNVDDLYRRNGEYEYRDGINPRAVVSLAAGIAVALLGWWSRRYDGCTTTPGLWVSAFPAPCTPR
jgi:nucleobase:cation symporter-1, NCS1 family